jgi:RNA polymerase sigma-70 factor (ECF subfamily)
MPAIAQTLSAAAARGVDPISPVLERLLSRYASTVREAARRHSLSEWDIDEVFQDVRIRLWRALATSEKISAAPASYVYRAAMSAAVDLIRRRGARREQGLEWHIEALPAGASARPDRAVEADELVVQLARALAELGGPRRVVVRMHLAGYHRNEIAELLGWSEAKTRNLLYRGLSNLKAILEGRRVEAGTMG